MVCFACVTMIHFEFSFVCNIRYEPKFYVADKHIGNSNCIGKNKRHFYYFNFLLKAKIIIMLCVI
jgi:hypothetical protein